VKSQDHDDPRVEIRKLEHEEDARTCARLMSSSEPWITLRRTYDISMKILTSPTREVYVARVDGEIVGFIILIMQGAFVGFIQTVAVMPEWRNHGVGSRLMRYAEERILRVTPNVFVCVSSFNGDARRLYERMGYEVVGELKELIVPGHSEILLRKTIGPLAEFKPKP
jgi:ribosomal protein S18 acetylase RimI-like enzyme